MTKAKDQKTQQHRKMWICITREKQTETAPSGYKRVSEMGV